MFRFVNADDIGNTPKRQQVPRACETCRKRKKRCHHAEAGDVSQPAPREEQRQEIRQVNPPFKKPRTEGATEVSRNRERSYEDSSRVDSPRLPEHKTTDENQHIISSDIETETEPAPTSERNASLGSRFIGDLNPESIFLAAASPNVTRGASLNDSVGVWLSKNIPHETNRLVIDPPPSSLFHGSSPIVQKAVFPLLQQECLVTLPSPSRVSALSSIYFQKNHPIFPVIDESRFNSLPENVPSRVLLQQGICLAASKHAAARQYLVLGESEEVLDLLEFGDRISSAMRLSIELGLVLDKIIVIQAYALMSQFVDSPDGGDLSSQFCSRAVHCTQSIGLHVEVQQRDHHDPYSATLFCCIWAIDRMNAAFNGRAVFMHERDTRKDLEQLFEQQEPCFRLFLRMIVLLNRVIGLYRPTATNEDQLVLDKEFSSFEDLVTSCSSEPIGTWAIATIETLYHAVSILACRAKPPAEIPRSSIAYLRQTNSTSALCSTIGELQDLVPFPFVPYSISLALSTSYRELRYSKVSIHRARARTQFQIISDALSGLKGTFRSAETTAELGKKLLNELDRVVSAVSNNKQPVAANLPTGPLATMLADQNVIQPAAAATQPTLDNHQIVHDFDPSYFDSFADVDLFGMFDPDFNLDDLDACLESNLNPSFPS